MEFKFILLEPVFGFRFIFRGLLSVFVTAIFFSWECVLLCLFAEKIEDKGNETEFEVLHFWVFLFCFSFPKKLKRSALVSDCIIGNCTFLWLCCYKVMLGLRKVVLLPCQSWHSMGFAD